MTPKILLVNPPIYDFAAYDFWLKPYGLLSVAGYLRGKADFKLFDYLDRLHQFVAEQKDLASDQWGRGRFYHQVVANPPCLQVVPRYFRRFGLPRSMFEDFLVREKPFDFALIQTAMTYWYLGVQEVIQDIRRISPQTKIVLGGNYVTLCSNHAKRLAADLLVPGTNLEPLWKYLQIEPDFAQPGFWEGYQKLNTGVLRLSDGCPFECTYCSVPQVYGRFKARPLQRSLAELELLANRGVQNIAFYDDALLFEPEEVLVPFLNELIRKGIRASLHSPNALNARFITQDLARLMVRAGFKTFYLGFESCSVEWQEQTGSKVFSQELQRAVELLLAAGVQGSNATLRSSSLRSTSITAYQMLAHPHGDTAELEASMRFVHSLGIRGMLADFSPIPGTPDGEYCRKWIDMDEPLMHNKTAFPIIMLGFDESNRLKDLQRRLNRLGYMV